MKLTKALADRFRSRASQEHASPVKDDMERQPLNNAARSVIQYLQCRST